MSSLRRGSNWMDVLFLVVPSLATERCTIKQKERHKEEWCHVSQTTSWYLLPVVMDLSIRFVEEVISRCLRREIHRGGEVKEEKVKKDGSQGNLETLGMNERRGCHGICLWKLMMMQSKKDPRFPCIGCWGRKINTCSMSSREERKEGKTVSLETRKDSILFPVNPNTLLCLLWVWFLHLTMKMERERDADEESKDASGISSSLDYTSPSYSPPLDCHFHR